MKLPIRKEFFDQIEAGDKGIEIRDAHITFICEETGRAIRKDISDAAVMSKKDLGITGKFGELFDDDKVVVFKLVEPCLLG